jgi:multidrug efflux system membrane fusion protein
MNENEPSRRAGAGGTAAIARPPRKTFVARWRLPLILLALAVLAAGAWLLIRHFASSSGSPGGPGGKSGANAPMPVVAATARNGDMPIVVNGLGTVTPVATVTVQSQISGQITAIAFKEGQPVKPGDFLIQVDPRPYQVALEQAQGALARDQALLANARIDQARYQTLFAQDSIAEQQLATQKALVAQDEGTVKADQGQVDAARLNLVYCHIVSPIGGRVGLQQVNLGNYVTPSEANGLVVVTQLKPITVVFTLAEDQIPALLKQLHAGKTLQVTAYDRSHTTRIATGSLAAIDSQIDTTTGTIRLKASFANDDESLFPNQFVNVDLLLDTLHDATLIPQAAVQRGAPGTYVYVVKPDNTVSLRKVRVGPGDAASVTIAAGLQAGDIVVVDGADRLKEGAKVLLPATPAAGAADAGAAAPAAGPAAEHKHHRHSDGNAPDSGPAQPAPQ